MRNIGKAMQVFFGVVGAAGLFAGLMFGVVFWVITGNLPEYQPAIRFVAAILFCAVMYGIGVAIDRGDD